MENTLQMRIESAFSLNFLIYIQNIYLNQNRRKNDQLKFPYTAHTYEFPDDFKKRYEELWILMTKRIYKLPVNDLLKKDKNLFYHSLFYGTDFTLEEFNDLYLSFRVWWNSLAGSFSIDRSIDEHIHGIYTELSNSLVKKEIKPEKAFFITLIYDDCLLIDLEPSSYFAVLSIKDFFMNQKTIIPKLELNIT